MTGSIGFYPLLALLFIGLKLGGVIAWPWIGVLAPLWGPLVIALLVMGLAALGTVTIAGLDSRNRKRKATKPTVRNLHSRFV